MKGIIYKVMQILSSSITHPHVIFKLLKRVSNIAPDGPLSSVEHKNRTVEECTGTLAYNNNSVKFQ